MTAVLQPNQLWSSMPGWGIVADLTPPELVASRRLRVIRKLIAAALVAILVLCGALYGLAVLHSQSASQALASENQRTASLRAEQRRYDDVTEIQTTLGQVQKQLANLLAGDVAYSTLLAQLRASLPPGVTIGQAQITVSAPSAAAANAATSGSLDTSGHSHIGLITLAGTAVHITDVASFVDRLAKLTGIVDVLSPSTQITDKGLQYSVTGSFTDELLTHTYDPQKNGGK